MNEPIQPEELTELLDDDLEMWAAGGTRILPTSKSQSKPQPQSQQPVSYPPVAYTPASVPPPAAVRSNAPIWAALAGMMAVFTLAGIAGGVFLLLHHDRPETVTATGTVQTLAAGNGQPIYVDGKQAGVGGGDVQTACGKHAVAVGTGKPKTYDIPCNGPAIVVGSPDGQ